MDAALRDAIETKSGGKSSSSAKGGKPVGEDTHQHLKDAGVKTVGVGPKVWKGTDGHTYSESHGTLEAHPKSEVSLTHDKEGGVSHAVYNQSHNGETYVHATGASPKEALASMHERLKEVSQTPGERHTYEKGQWKHSKY